MTPGTSRVAQRLMAQSGGVVILPEPLAEVGPTDVLVRTAFSVVSPGTERSIIRATRSSVSEAHEYPNPDYRWPVVRDRSVSGPARLPRMPRTDAASLGYSLSGVVEAVGTNVLGVGVGDAVACSGSQCAYHADRVVVPRSLTAPIPSGVDLVSAAHVTLGAIALEALRRTECAIGESVVMIGAGMLGLLLTQLSRLSGVYPIAVDTDVRRLGMAEDFGAILTVDSASGAGVAAIHHATAGFGADAVIVAAADPADTLINFALDVLRPGGRLVVLGDFGMDIERAKFFRARATVVPAVAYGPGRYDPVYEENGIDLPIWAVRWTENRNMALFLRLLAEARIDLTSFAPIQVPFLDASAAYARLLGAGSPMTAVLRYPDQRSI